VSERWVDVASYVNREPDVMRQLENDARTGQLGDTFHDLPAHDLAAVLREKPDLSDDIERRIRFEPGNPAPRAVNTGTAVPRDEPAATEIAPQ
jgi:hypothetical protein